MNFFVVLFTLCSVAYCAQAQFFSPPGCNLNVASSYIQQTFVPTILSTPPLECLSVIYPGVQPLNLGTIVTPTEVKNGPPAVNWNAIPTEFYTLQMIDHDEQSYKPVNIWTVGNIPGSDVAAGQIIDDYLGIGPSRRDGYNRYVFTVYLQPNGPVEFTQSFVSATNFTTRAQTDVLGFAAQYNLDPIAGNWLQAAYDDYTPVLWAELGLPVSVAEEP